MKICLYLRTVINLKSCQDSAKKFFLTCYYSPLARSYQAAIIRQILKTHNSGYQDSGYQDSDYHDLSYQYLRFIDPGCQMIANNVL